MKKYSITIIMLCLMALPALKAQEAGWGVGIKVGDPTGVSFKKYMEKWDIELNVGHTATLHGHEPSWYFYNRWDTKIIG